MMITNTNKMIYTAAIKCYDVAMMHGTSRKLVYHVNKIFNDKHQKLPGRS